MKKLLAALIALTMLLGMVPAMAADAVDTITIMVPPVSGTYQEDLVGWAADYEAANPGIKIEIINTTWDDHNSKLSTAVQGRQAPDIAEVSYAAVGTYVDLGVAVDITSYMGENLADYDQNALDYMTIENGLYGLPLYITIQSIGGNKAMLEAAGADVAKIQTEGWTYEEFLQVIQNGTKDDTFGFVFANDGVTAYDFLYIFGVSAGLPNGFTPDLKFAYTSDNMLMLLKSVETMTKSGAMPNYGVQAGQRLVMCETGNAMIFGKAMPLFENNINKNNAAIDANDGTAVANSIKLDYAFLPVPTMEGIAPTCYGQVDGMIVLKNSANFNDETHRQHVVDFLHYICSGERVATVDASLLLEPTCASGREAYAAIKPEGLDAGNVAAAARCISLVVAPPKGITAEMSANALVIRDEVIVPQFQALLAGETTAEEVFNTIIDAAYDTFGEENCVHGMI